MHDPAAAVKAIIDAFPAGAQKPSYAIHLGIWPSTPDKVTLITPSGGRSPMPKFALNFPSVQVKVRGKPSGYQDAYDEMRKICNVLLGLGNATANADVYRSCNQMGDIISLGQDENNRQIFSANFWFIVEPSDLGNRVAIT